MTWDKVFRSVCAVLGAVGGFLFGQLNGLFYAVIAMMANDYVTGVMLAAVNRKLSSRTGFRGIVRKLFMVMLIAVGHIIDAQVIGSGAALMSAVELFFIANEGISVLENAAALGLPIPQKLRDVLEQLRDKGDNNGN